MRRFTGTICIVCSILFFGLFANGQGNSDEGAETSVNADFELGAQLGNILPNQVPGVTEIHPQWGLLMGFGMGGDGTAEVMVTSGKGNGVDWTQVSASVRLDVPIEGLVGIAYIGVDATHYKGVDMAKKVFGGGHAGGGVMTVLARDLWFRADMKFSVNPGTSLYIGGGFIFRFDGGDSAD